VLHFWVACEGVCAEVLAKRFEGCQALRSQGRKEGERRTIKPHFKSQTPPLPADPPPPPPVVIAGNRFKKLPILRMM